MGKPKTYKIYQLFNKLTELLVDVICVMLGKTEWTRSISQRTVTVILMEGERSDMKKIRN